MDYKIQLEQKRIVRIHTVIDFEKEVRIREKAFEIEKEIRDLFPHPATVFPVGEDEPEEIQRLLFIANSGKCTFSQNRMSYVVFISEEKGKNLEQCFGEINNNANSIFKVIKDLTGKDITSMGIISDVIVPLGEQGNAILYLQNTFFKFQCFNTSLTALDFHFAQQYNERYNINVVIRAQKSRSEQESDNLYISVDVNDYLDQRIKGIKSYDLDEINRVFAFEKELVISKLNNILKNQLDLEG